MVRQPEAGAANMDVQFYGFLHLRDTEQSTVNVQVSSFLDQVRIYCSNTLALKRSFDAYGLPFTLLAKRHWFMSCWPCVRKILRSGDSQ